MSNEAPQRPTPESPNIQGGRSSRNGSKRRIVVPMEAPLVIPSSAQLAVSEQEIIAIIRILVEEEEKKVTRLVVEAQSSQTPKRKIHFFLPSYNFSNDNFNSEMTALVLPCLQFNRDSILERFPNKSRLYIKNIDGILKADKTESIKLCISDKEVYSHDKFDEDKRNEMAITFKKEDLKTQLTPYDGSIVFDKQNEEKKKRIEELFEAPVLFANETELLKEVEGYEEKIKFTSSFIRWLKTTGVRKDQVKRVQNIIGEYKEGKKTKLKTLRELCVMRAEIINDAKVTETKANGKRICDSKLWKAVDGYISKVQAENIQIFINALEKNEDKFGLVKKQFEGIKNYEDFFIFFGSDRDSKLKNAMIQYLQDMPADKFDNNFYPYVQAACFYMLYKNVSVNDESDHNLKKLNRLINLNENIINLLYKRKWQSFASEFKKLVDKNDIEGVEYIINHTVRYIASQGISQDLGSFDGAIQHFLLLANFFEKVLSNTPQLKQHWDNVFKALNDLIVKYFSLLEKLPTSNSLNIFRDILKGRSWLQKSLENKSRPVQYALSAFFKKFFTWKRISFNDVVEFFGKSNESNKHVLNFFATESDEEIKNIVTEELKRLIKEKNEERLNQIINGTSALTFAERKWGEIQQLREVLCGLPVVVVTGEYDEEENKLILSLLGKININEINNKAESPQSSPSSSPQVSSRRSPKASRKKSINPTPTPNLLLRAKYEFIRLLKERNHPEIDRILQRGHLLGLEGILYGTKDEIKGWVLEYVSGIKESAYRDLFNAGWRQEYFPVLSEELVKTYNSISHKKAYNAFIEMLLDVKKNRIPVSAKEDFKKLALDFASRFYISAEELENLKTEISTLGKAPTYILGFFRAFLKVLNNEKTNLDDDSLLRNYDEYLEAFKSIIEAINSLNSETHNVKVLVGKFLNIDPKEFVKKDIDILLNKISAKISLFIDTPDAERKTKTFDKFFAFFSDATFNDCKEIVFPHIVRLRLLCALGSKEYTALEYNLMIALLKGEHQDVFDAYQAIENNYTRDMIERVFHILLYANNVGLKPDLVKIFQKGGESLSPLSCRCAAKFIYNEFVTAENFDSTLLKNFVDPTAVIEELVAVVSPPERQNLLALFERYLKNIIENDYGYLREEQLKKQQNKTQLVGARLGRAEARILMMLYSRFKGETNLADSIAEVNIRAMNQIRKLTSPENIWIPESSEQQLRNLNLFASAVMLVKMHGDHNQLRELNSRTGMLFHAATYSDKDPSYAAKLISFLEGKPEKTPDKIKCEIERLRANKNIFNPDYEFKYKAVHLSESINKLVLDVEKILAVKMKESGSDPVRFDYMADLPPAPSPDVKLEKPLNLLCYYMSVRNIDGFDKLVLGDFPEGELKQAYDFIVSFQSQYKNFFNMIKNILEVRVLFLKMLSLLSQGTYGEVFEKLNSLEDKITALYAVPKKENITQIFSFLYLDILRFSSKLKATINVNKEKGGYPQFSQMEINLGIFDSTQASDDMKKLQGAHKKSFDVNLLKFFHGLNNAELLVFLSIAIKNKDSREFEYLKLVKGNKDFISRLDKITENFEGDVIEGKKPVSVLEIGKNLRCIRAVKLLLLNDESLRKYQEEFYKKSSTTLEALTEEFKSLSNNDDLHIGNIKRNMARMMAGDSYFQIKLFELLLSSFECFKKNDSFLQYCIDCFSSDDSVREIKHTIGGMQELRNFYLRAVLKDVERENGRIGRLINDLTIGLDNKHERDTHFQFVSDTIIQMIQDGQINEDILRLINNLRARVESTDEPLEGNSYGKLLWNYLNEIKELKIYFPKSTSPSKSVPSREVPMYTFVPTVEMLENIDLSKKTSTPIVAGSSAVVVTAALASAPIVTPIILNKNESPIDTDSDDDSESALTASTASSEGSSPTILKRFSSAPLPDLYDMGADNAPESDEEVLIFELDDDQKDESESSGKLAVKPK
jgi:hypothetical protein